MGTVNAALESNGTDYDVTAEAPATSGSFSTQSVTAQTTPGTWDGPVTDSSTIGVWTLQPDGTYTATVSITDELTQHGDGGSVYYPTGTGTLGIDVTYSLKKQYTVTRVADVTFTAFS